MKNSFLLPNSIPFARPSHRRGIALVIVLTMLVLLSGILIAFMMSAANERTASQASSSSATTRQIADSTLNLVLAQIREATTPPNGVTWASQPGAIRTFGGKVSQTKITVQPSGGPSGAYYYSYAANSNDYVFKLYSADQLRPTAAEYKVKDLPEEVKVIENWDPKKPTADYVDLNQPYLSARLDLDTTGLTVEPRYPIIDPRAKYDANEKEVTGGAPGVVDGFDAKITKDASLKLANPAGTGASPGNVPYLPMPVKWLYVLKDGTVGSPSLATATNPVVGRTAFWTDDESCKLNVNTASEGTFWDTPMVSTEQESGQITAGDPGTLASSSKSLSLSGSQPARFEYQRYPGHPATTCLSPVLGWLWNVPPSGVATSANLVPQDTTYNAFKEAIYQITAFTPYGAGTSKGATGNTDPGTGKPDPKLSVATKHLFATVDEMMLKSQRTTGGVSGKSVPNAKLTPSALEKVRFFLSANSRAPELNLYGRPRLTIWPIHDDPNLRTPFDDLFAFTSTISTDPGGNANKDKRFNLTRVDAKSNITDYTTQNAKMYGYLQALTNVEVPGFGGKFTTKYGADRDQILTEIFDYIRTVNLVDTGTASRSTNLFIPYTPKFYRLGYQESYGRAARSVDWSGQVTPLKISTNGQDTYGLGRFITITEAALIFHRTGAVVSGKQPTMQAVLALEMGTPMAGYPTIRETYFTKIRAITPLKVKIGAAGTPDDAGLCSTAAGPTPAMVNICNVPAHEVTEGRGFMPCLGATSSMHYFLEHKSSTDPTAYVDPDNATTGDPNRNKQWYVDPAKQDRVGVKTFTNTSPSSTAYQRGETVKYYPYVTKQITIPATLAATDQIFTFQDCEYEVEIWSGEAPDDKYPSSIPNGPKKNDPRAVLVQKVHLHFPPPGTQLPLPNTNSQQSFAARFDGTLEGHHVDWINASNDTVRSIELTCNGASNAKKGDMRIAMARFDVPTKFFESRDPVDYSSNARMIHGLTSSHGEGVNGNTSIPLSGQPITKGILAKGGTRGGKIPNIPSLITTSNGVERSDSGPGDWDRGLSKHEDGAMANKVDEGNVRFDYGNGTAAYKLPYFHGRNVEETGQTFFTPNRQLPSAVMFGSLPTGVIAEKGWQTLLFRPDRETGKTHPGALFPEDHLLLDLFNLPVVEPYAISEPFSTAGKVNMNHVIAPFGYAGGGTGTNGATSATKMARSYLRRDTALRGVLKSTWMMAVPTSFAEGAHTELPTSLDASQTANQLRHPINMDKTIEGMDVRLNDQNSGLGSRSMDLFRSASEICTVDLFPMDLTVSASWGKFWEDYAQTGDNMRERPYAHIYPRLTTKSNVFTVHMRCQAIRKAPAGAPDPYQVVGEYRGSAIVERFVDPNDQNLANYNQANDPMQENVDGYYRYRIVATKQFAPH